MTQGNKGLNQVLLNLTYNQDVFVQNQWNFKVIFFVLFIGTPYDMTDCIGSIFVSFMEKLDCKMRIYIQLNNIAQLF